jgi:hypothetical protein
MPSGLKKSFSVSENGFFFATDADGAIDYRAIFPRRASHLCMASRISGNQSCRW